MLTKSQANAAADALVEGSKAERIAHLEAGESRIPRVYQSRLLSRVPSWRQTQLVAEARKTAGFAWLPEAFAACVILLVAVLWFSAGHSRLALALLPFVCGFGPFVGLFRLSRVKLKLQELLLEELAPEQRNGT